MIFYTSFSVVFPLFAYILFGYLLRLCNLLSESTTKELNRVVFLFFLPFLLFSTIYSTDFSTIENYSLLLETLAFLTLLFLFYMVRIRSITKKSAQRGVLVQAIIRSNFIIFGVPMAMTLYNRKPSGIGPLLIGIIVPAMNVVSVLSLELFQEKRSSFFQIGKKVITNPIVVGGVVGVIASLTKLSIPPLLSQFIDDIGELSTSLALILLGASVTFSSLGKNKKLLAYGTIHRLIIIPVVGLALFIALGYRNQELILLLAMLASPTAVSSFVMAQQMGKDETLAGQLVVTTTVISLFTLFLWVTLLLALGLI